MEAVQRGAVKLTMPVDGIETDSVSTAGTTLDQPDQAFGISNRDTNCSSTKLDGQIDDVRLYNRALNADEIKFLASVCNNPGHMPGTMLYNQDHAVLQYCNGQDWIGIGK
jgi:Concanavalin A-like lectin/glucanases superfamily